MAKNRIEPISLSWYLSRPGRDEYHLIVQPVWPIDMKNSDFVKKHLKEFVEKSIKYDPGKDYMDVEIESKFKVKVSFKADKWMRDNFLTKPRVEFHFPRTLEFKFKKNLPKSLVSHTDSLSLKNFMEKSFKSFTKDHKTSMFKDKLKIMKKINYDWFEYEVDLQFNRVYLRIKNSVLMTLTAGAYALSQSDIGKKKSVDSWSEIDI